MYAKEYIEYLVHFHGDRDYFECHEILEEYWKLKEPRNKESILVAFILFAVGNYHYRRNNYKGARRTLEKALQLFNKNKDRIQDFGIKQDEFLKLIQERICSIESHDAYKSINFPLSDPYLLDACMEFCQRMGLIWRAESDMNNDDLIHRHCKRDRSDVIRERIYALKNRQKKI